jgi:hypothetical protein
MSALFAQGSFAEVHSVAQEETGSVLMNGVVYPSSSLDDDPSVHHLSLYRWNDDLEMLDSGPYDDDGALVEP